jgi:hypothetical protein
MHKLSFQIVLIILSINCLAQSPHGDSFKKDCKECHTAEGWKIKKSEKSFDHNATRFKLTGQHQTVDCRLCHKSLKFLEAKSECAACHADIHKNTLGPDCGRCHNSKAWIISNTNTITMHQMSRFPLLGNHAVADCALCHKSYPNLQFEQLGVECVDCHLADYQATTSPNHQQLGYSTNCYECHGVRAISWNASSFEHGFFPLTAGHNISCMDCHTDGKFQKLPSDCISCHANDYNSTTNPNHQQAGISTTCADCHTTNPGWKPASFANHNNYYPLTGAHAKIANDCNTCHKGNYSNTPNTCYDCHKADYDGTKNPAHSTAQFPKECENCHTTIAWEPSTFNHDSRYFPIYSGKHKGKWTLCSECHTSPTNYTLFSCINCHEHSNKTSVDGEHKGVNGYAYNSVACYTCHPKGN